MLKIVTSFFALLLFIVDLIRLRNREPLRREGVSLLYFLLFFIILYSRTPTPVPFSCATFIIFLAACGLTIVHGAVTVFNFWIVLTRLENPLAFYLIAWTGIILIFLGNISLIWII